MSYHYRVTLTPQEPYFFGGEQTFGRDDSRKDGSRYSAVSTHFPQQSAVLGMLRKTMLIQESHMSMHIKNGEWIDSRGKSHGADSNYDAAVKLTGKESFSYERESDFGIIRELSALFIHKDGTDYTLNAKDAKYTPKILDSKMNLNGITQETLFLEGYSAKNPVADHFVGSDKSILSFDDIFMEVKSVGIKKSTDGEDNQESFFQKTSLMLKDRASFVFYLTLDKELSWDDAYITLGAEQSPFKLKLSPTNKTFQESFSHVFEKKAFDRVLLHSETLLSEDAYKDAKFILGRRNSYRQLKSRDGKKSKRYYLLERGSVIYSDNIEQLSANLAQKHLQKVGINNFTTIKGL
jgi:CRISPR type III-B/RAMP module-associated protein Cmr3